MPDIDREALIESFQSHLIQGKSYARINEARAQAEAVLGTAIPSGSPLTKGVDEAMEAAVVRSAREMIQQSQTVHEAFDRLVDLLERQPTLGVRSSTSVRQQAYSTPIPIAFLAASLAGVTAETTVYEPTAGHAALLLTTNPQQSVVNELNPDRVTDLRAQGYTVTENDAATYLPAEQVDVMLANPPFGSVKENGRTKEWLVWGGPATPQYVTTQIDQTIALKALQAMKDDGRSVLILSAPMGNKTGNQADAAASYNSRQNAPFYKSLYDNYNVTQHFCIAGSLYSKQGTTFPIDVIVIEGRGKSARPYPAAELPTVYRSFADLKELLPDGDLSPVHLKVLDTTDRGLADPSVDSGARASELERDSDLQPIPGTPERSPGLADARDVGTGEFEPGGAISADPQYAQPGRDVPVGDARNGRIDTGMGRSSDDEQYGTPGGDAVLASLGLEGRSDTIRLSSSTDDQEWTGSDSNLDSRDIAGRVAESDDHHLPQSVAPTTPSLETAIMDNDIKQVPYQPQSQAPYAGTLVPTNLQTAVKDSLIRLEQKVGSIDTFVDYKVNLGTTRIQPFAEQIDSVALAIDNLEQGEAFILGDQTGIGKGLQLAEIAKAQLSCTLNLPYSQDVNTLVFVTYDAKLYTDFLRDLNDVGIETIKPLVTNSDFTLNLPDGTKSKTGGSKEQKALLERLAMQQDLGDYNIVFTTYSQLQTVKGQETARRDFLRSIAPQSLFIFDESHNAGGTSNDTAQSGPQNRADFVRSLVQQAGGVVFSSATYAKNPYTMTLYASRTGMRHAVEDQFSFSDIVQSGGVPLQQMLAAKLAESGQYLRRERSFEGVEFSAKVVEVDKEIAQNMATVMSSIMEFDRAKKVSVKQIDKDLKKSAKQVVSDGSTGAAGASSTNFTSIMHNVIGQTLLALKAEETVQDTLAILRNNQKPVITLYNTMGSTIGRAAEEQDLKPGDPIDLSVGDLLLRYLDRSRDVIEKDAFGDRTRRQLTDEELNPLALHLYEDTKELIQETDWNGIPVSPIDYIRHRLEQEGYRTGEITGRDDRIEYGSDGLQTYQTRSSKERGTTAAIQNVAAFNAGEMDVIILNRSGSTGISLHASERFADQRSRHMLICQPDLDINQFMQTLGRIHRTGQVELPSFSLVMGDIAAEKRPAAVLLKKMASLNANTTAARDSSFSLGEVVDFLNEYGDQVAVEVMANHPDLHAKLGYPISGLTEDSDLNAIDTEGAIAKVTGRIPLLPLSHQERVYGLIEREYLELLEREQAMGTSSLEAETVDLQAKTLARMEVMPAKEGVDSPFAEPAFLEIVEAKSPRKPLTALEVTNLVWQELELPPVENIDRHSEDLVEERAQQRTQQTIQDLRERTQVYRERALERLTQSHVSGQENAETEDGETEANEKLTFKITQLNDKLNRQARTVEQWLEQFPVGQSVCLTGNRDGDFHYGVVQKVIDRSSEEGNPVAPSMWRLQIQVADATQQLIVPFSKINTESITGVSLRQEVLDWRGNEIINKFDEKQQEVYEQRQIFTGNVIRAAEQFTGKLINYTTEDGEIHQGMLMARNFKIEEALEEQPVIMTTPEFCQRFLEVTENKGTLKSADQRLSVMGLRDGKLALMTDASKQKGGDYFLDDGLIAAAGAEFTSLGERMRLVVEADKVEAVLTYLYESHGKLRAFTHQDKARELTGLDLPTMETVEPPMQASRISTLESSAVSMQAELPIVSSVEEASPGGDSSPNGNAIASTEIAMATLSTALGNLTVRVLEAPDDYLRLEFEGATANWMEYPAQTRIDHVMQSDVAVMADGLQDIANYAQFAVQQVHQDFVQHLDAEVQRIAPALRRWLQQNEVGDSEIAAAFMEHYPERDRIGLTPEFMQLAIQTVVQNEGERSDQTQSQEGLDQLSQSEATAETALATTRILPSRDQFGRAEKTIAKFFDQAGLAEIVFNAPKPEQGFHLRIENEPYLPLVVERHDECLYLTYYRQDDFDLVHDGEIVFHLSDTGHLKLCETAVQNPFTGGESRGLDKSFGAMFARNILDQGFAEAAQQAWAARQTTQTMPAVEVIESGMVEATTQTVPDGVELCEGQLTQSFDVEISSAQARETELARGQEILQIAERAYAYGEAIDKLQLDANNEFWTVSSQNYDISYNPLNDNFFVVGKDGSEMTAQSIGGILDPTCTGNIAETDLQAFRATATALDQADYQTGRSPAETVAIALQRFANAQAKQEQSVSQSEPLASVLPIAAVNAMPDSVAQPNSPTSMVPTTEQPEQSQRQVSVEDVRNWYRQARDVGRSDRHLSKIEQIGKAFVQGQPLGDRDLKAMDQDRFAWREQTLTIAQHANTILEAGGEPLETGKGIGYIGSTYTVYAEQNTVYAFAKGRGVQPSEADRQNLPSEILKSGRGMILKVEQVEPDVKVTRVTTADAHRFDMVANRLQRQSQRQEIDSERLHAVGFDR